MTIARKIFDVVEAGPNDSNVSRLYDVCLISIIILNVLFLCLETVRDIDRMFHQLFVMFEWGSVAVFSAEYLVRLWVCTENPKFQNSFRGRLKYIFSPMAVVDLLSFLPFLIFVYSSNAKLLSIIRVFRLFRLLKLAEYSKALYTLGRVLHKTKSELLTTGFVTFVLLICASTVMYVLENTVQPEKFSSIPMTMWWGVTALTTVGYGDVYPITPLGKFFASLVAILGIGVFALPAGILGAAFLEELQVSKSKK